MDNLQGAIRDIVRELEDELGHSVPFDEIVYHVQDGSDERVTESEVRHAVMRALRKGEIEHKHADHYQVRRLNELERALLNEVVDRPGYSKEQYMEMCAEAFDKLVGEQFVEEIEEDAEQFGRVFGPGVAGTGYITD